MNENNALPCVSVQDQAILRAAGALTPLPEPDESGRTQHTNCVHLGDEDPSMMRVWEANGSVATVTFFDIGNGWAQIENVEAATPEDADKFAADLWDQILNELPNRQQNRDLVAQAAGGCNKPEGCHCAKMLAASPCAA